MVQCTLFLSSDNREESDNDDWEARENSRTHSVKFSEDSNADKETPFVRQNTPHPKDLKAKAHKLFSKDKKEDDTMVLTNESKRFQADAFEKIPETVSFVAMRWRCKYAAQHHNNISSFSS
jgi:carboxylesterase type B